MLIRNINNSLLCLITFNCTHYNVKLRDEIYKRSFVTFEIHCHSMPKGSGDVMLVHLTKVNCLTIASIANHGLVGRRSSQFIRIELKTGICHIQICRWYETYRLCLRRLSSRYLSTCCRRCDSGRLSASYPDYDD